MIFRRLLNDTQKYLSKVRSTFPDSHQSLFRFETPEDLAVWKVFSDAEFGGTSTAALQPGAVPGTAELAGHFSTVVQEGGGHQQLRRSGFCGMNSKVGDGCLDLDDYDTLVFRVCGDGRKYIANIRTENWVVGESAYDVWQAFLFSRPGEWQDVAIPLDRFLLTWRGKVVDTQMEMNPRRILSLGISLAGGSELQPEGPYRLALKEIMARNSAWAGSSGD